MIMLFVLSKKLEELEDSEEESEGSEVLKELEALAEEATPESEADVAELSL